MTRYAFQAIILRMNNRSKIQWITRTAILIALLVVLQAATMPLGTTIVTGSVVNMLLVVSVMIGGLASGITVAVVSPVLAKLVGIGPLWTLIPFIILGNITLVLLWHNIGNRNMGKPYIAHVAALAVAAIAKFLVLYVGIVQIAVPLLLGLPAQQAAAISAMFSVAQLFTALIGGAVATILLPTLKKAVNK